MATGRTVSASFLTELDERVIELCNIISQEIQNNIPNKLQKDFEKEYGKISKTRDGGLGLGGGKLQRDALCTRGQQGKAPYSNRNLRWHPLVVAAQPINFAKTIEQIEIEGDDDEQILVFSVKVNNTIKKYPSDKTYELPKRYVALPEHWIPHISILRHWNDTLWTQNSCIIPALESCDWHHAVETYSILGIAIAVEHYQVDFDKIYPNIIDILMKQKINKEISLPSKLFPRKKEQITNCPVCRLPLSDELSRFKKKERIITWQPDWRPSKKKEGDDGSNQILHVTPLIETEIKHKPDIVRYGHRWCNVAMTDHSLDETLDFMEFIVKAHDRCKYENK
ncbi:hypothetical protein AMJ80_02185 [bacterium SM23_31]|nr:MAG: hypothetical protein AMJ80_02185 [bacterium SM23_31]